MKYRSQASIRIATSFILTIAIAFAASTVNAHHSPSKYDLSRIVTVTGVLTKLQWANPHVYVYIEETTDTGAKVEWEIEVFPPSLLRRMGWTRDTVRIGETLTVKGNPGKNAKHKDLFPSVIKRGDTPLFVLANALKDTTPKVVGKTNGLAGIWSTSLEMRVMRQAASPAASTLTKQGLDARKRFDENTSPTSNCIPSPPPLWMITPDLKRITLGKSAVRIENDQGYGRTIHMDASTHDGALPSIQGHSVGRWEGTTLVIDTTHFAYHGTGNGGGNGIGAGVPSSTRKHLLERFTLNADGSALTYQFELNDPEYLAVPRKGSVQWTYNPVAKFETEPCDLAIARRYIKE